MDIEKKKYIDKHSQMAKNTIKQRTLKQTGHLWAEMLQLFLLDRSESKSSLFTEVNKREASDNCAQRTQERAENLSADFKTE